MAKVAPFQTAHRRDRRRWTQASDYSAPAAKRAVPWFGIALVALPAAAFTAVWLAPSLGGGPEQAVAAVPFSAPVDSEQAHFPICGSGPRITCVVDGDTIWYQGTKIRIADIDTPEVANPGCAREAQLGGKATYRMQYLLNQGAFTLAGNPDGRDTDRYGRTLRVVTRGGASLGDTLVSEGLAERWGGPRINWC